ncbi:hypothetical protein EST38_g8790 [Candolleomyces aberdarensis]|uniref:Uncharacterized protein n=1 Tax=Candolleomyces aberdarensis TaxID=2316362 RepID=A0A4Q2DBR4_9AGAR|nr:hypothetical protein EST38_g8790 [Candolleomyces aberdarensis]
MRTNLELAISEVSSSIKIAYDSRNPTSSCTIPLTNLICAYIRIAGFVEAAQALPSFERALEKYPDSAEKAGSKEAQRAQLVASVRKEYWKEVLDDGNTTLSKQRGGDGTGSKRLFSCPCCGRLVSSKQMMKALDLEGESKNDCDSSGEYRYTPSKDSVINGLIMLDAAPKKTVKKKRTRTVKRRIQNRKQEDVSKMTFDPYGPSTSKASIQRPV